MASDLDGEPPADPPEGYLWFQLHGNGECTPLRYDGEAWVTPDEYEAADDSEWPFCPNCGSELERPAGPYQEWTDCPTCGEVCIEFTRGERDE